MWFYHMPPLLFRSVCAREPGNQISHIKSDVKILADPGNGGDCGWHAALDSGIPPARLDTVIPHRP